MTYTYRRSTSTSTRGSMACWHADGLRVQCRNGSGYMPRGQSNYLKQYSGHSSGDSYPEQHWDLQMSSSGPVRRPLNDVCNTSHPRGSARIVEYSDELRSGHYHVQRTMSPVGRAVRCISPTGGRVSSHHVRYMSPTGRRRVSSRIPSTAPRPGGRPEHRVYLDPVPLRGLDEAPRSGAERVIQVESRGRQRTADYQPPSGRSDAALIDDLAKSLREGNTGPPEEPGYKEYKGNTGPPEEPGYKEYKVLSGDILQPTSAHHREEIDRSLADRQEDAKQPLTSPRLQLPCTSSGGSSRSSGLAFRTSSPVIIRTSSPVGTHRPLVTPSTPTSEYVHSVPSTPPSQGAVPSLHNTSNASSVPDKNPSRNGVHNTSNASSVPDKNPSRNGAIFTSSSTPDVHPSPAEAVPLSADVGPPASGPSPADIAKSPPDAGFAAIKPAAQFQAVRAYRDRRGRNAAPNHGELRVRSRSAAVGGAPKSAQDSGRFGSAVFAPRNLSPFEMWAVSKFDLDGAKWVRSEMTLAIDSAPFKKGSMRAAYLALQPPEQPGGPAVKWVAKNYLQAGQPRGVFFVDVEMQCLAARYAQLYNECRPPKKVEFITAFVIEALTTEPCGYPSIPRIACVEPWLPGDYRKHSNNYGFISEDDRNTPQAFSHFTYVASAGRFLIVDIQGVGDVYTDPQVHDCEGKRFGRGNLGMKGIKQFFSSHRCNNICRYLGLPEHGQKMTDCGTVCRESNPVGLNVAGLPIPGPPGLFGPPNTNGRAAAAPSSSNLFVAHRRGVRQ